MHMHDEQVETAYHYTVYDAASGAILDNMSDSEAIVVEDADRKAASSYKGIRAKATARANAAAPQPFLASFPEADP